MQMDTCNWELGTCKINIHTDYDLKTSQVFKYLALGLHVLVQHTGSRGKTGLESAKKLQRNAYVHRYQHFPDPDTEQV